VRSEGAQENVRATAMPQSLAKIYVHLIFSTKNRERLLPDDLRPGFCAYFGGILRDLGCTAVEINSEPDHVHLLFLASRTETLSDVVRQLKTGSNLWLQEQRPEFHHFHWQNGYGAFSVSQSGVEEVREYIRLQREHHRVMTFQEEYRKFLARHEIEFDERYVWD
jgi:putative transposase